MTISYHWKLKAIESVQASSNELPKEELLKLIDVLIDNYEVKEVITKALSALENHITLKPRIH
jgi:hypothetical protein